MLTSHIRDRNRQPGREINSQTRTHADRQRLIGKQTDRQIVGFPTPSQLRRSDHGKLQTGDSEYFKLKEKKVLVSASTLIITSIFGGIGLGVTIKPVRDRHAVPFGQSLLGPSLNVRS